MYVEVMLYILSYYFYIDMFTYHTGPVDTLLDWNTIQKKLPWGIIFLIGGGFALAKASTVC